MNAPVPIRYREPWSEAEDRILADGRNKGLTTTQLMDLLPGRTRRGIDQRISILRADGQIGYSESTNARHASGERASCPTARSTKMLLVALLRYGARRGGLPPLPDDEFRRLCASNRVRITA